jgi:hypothetical protein
LEARKASPFGASHRLSGLVGADVNEGLLHRFEKHAQPLLVTDLLLIEDFKPRALREDPLPIHSDGRLVIETRLEQEGVATQVERRERLLIGEASDALIEGHLSPCQLVVRQQ